MSQDEINFDFTELTKLAADLGQVAEKTGPFLRTAFVVTSGKVKDDAIESVKTNQPSRRWKGLSQAAIDYDIKADLVGGNSVITSEIGYNPARYGKRAKLGNLREFGAPGADGVPLAPHNDLLNALHKNEKDFVKGIADATRDGERAAGL